MLFIVGIWTLALYDTPSKVAAPQKPPRSLEPAPVKKPPITAAERKKRFVEKTLPAIRNVKAELDALYAQVEHLSKKPHLNPAEEAMLETLKLRYRVAGIPCLLNRLKTHPVSIVLAQAALETGWGKSRFYNEANNIFGVWSYNRNEPRLAAGETRGDKTIYVKKYPSLEASIEGYFKMMATGRAYGEFRKARHNERNPFKLIRHLTRYSELREEYVKRLYYVIKANRLYEYDHPTFKPIALAEVLPGAFTPPAEKVAEVPKPSADGSTAALAAAGIPAITAAPVAARLPLEERNDVMIEDENISECPPLTTADADLDENGSGS